MGRTQLTTRVRVRAIRRVGIAALAGLCAAGGMGATVAQGHATVTTPTPTGTFAGGRVTGADGVLALGSEAISAADANFTIADVGFVITSQGIPTGATITSVIDSTHAMISAPATKKSTKSIFALDGANAALYGWGDATLPDGSVLVGDYWNNRIVHYNADGTEATPFVFSKSTFGFGTNTNQAPFGICVDNSHGPFQGDVYMTEGSLYNVIQYDPNGNWVTSWGTTNASHSVAFDYPSQCVVNPLNGLVYISNQFGKSIVVLNPQTNAATIVSPPSPNTFIQPRGLAFDGAGNIWIADQGHHRIDIYSPTCLVNPWPSGSACKNPLKSVLPPGGVTTTFDMRGLAIDITAPATTLTPTPVPLMFVTNGQNCLIQEFNADPTSNYKNVAFLTNFNQANLDVNGSDCGTPGVLGANGQFEDGGRGLTVDGNHNVWAGDLADFRTEVFDENGNFLVNVPGYWPGDNGATSPPSVPAGGGFNGPRGVTFDTAGNMYVTDMYNERIERFAPGGPSGWTLDTSVNAGSITPGAWGMRGDGPGQMNYPRLMCWDPLTQTGNGTGALIVANTDSNMIVAWNPNRVNNPPSVVWNDIGLADPYGVACDTNPLSPGYGLIYVANSNGKDIVVFNPDGSPAVNSMLTSNTMGVGSIVGFTRGITVDTDGSVWVDTGTASHVYHFASFNDSTQPGALLAQSDFTASSGSTNACNPFGIAATANFLYLACSSTNNVVYYAKNGATQPPTFKGTFGVYNAFDGIGTMHTPQGLALGGPNNDLFVVEENNDRVSEWQVPQ